MLKRPRGVRFRAPEVCRDGSIIFTDYEITHNEPDHWYVTRNLGEFVLEVHGRYRLIRSVCCGLCGTDLDRHHLPHPLPQIIGHEVVGMLDDGRLCVIDINDSHHAHDDLDGVAKCVFCQSDVCSQCPARITLGINRLPGGLSPFLLVPENSIVPLPLGMPADVGVFAEPFAAALHAVEISAPLNDQTVGVVGTRRLGNLVVAALVAFRKQRQFTITAVSRHASSLQVAQLLGADFLVDTSSIDPSLLHQKYDLVYDTSGSADGFQLALQMTKTNGTLHLKSTHGKEVLGLEQLTALVVEEIKLISLSETCFSNYSALQSSLSREVFLSPLMDSHSAKSMVIEWARTHAWTCRTNNSEEISDIGCDLAVIASLEELDEILRPTSEPKRRLVRARGSIALAGTLANEHFDWNLLERAIVDRGISVITSRCGNLSRSVQVLHEHPEVASVMNQSMLTHHFELSQVATAFSTARNSSESIKVLVATQSVE